MIKTPVRYDTESEILKDADGHHLADILVNDEEAQQIADALSAFEATQDVSNGREIQDAGAQ